MRQFTRQITVGVCETNIQGYKNEAELRGLEIFMIKEVMLRLATAYKLITRTA